jgi:hypothetical protein
MATQSGVTANKRPVQLIVSLTTIHERINLVHLAIESIMRQSLKPDRIILWLSETEIEKKAITTQLKQQQKRGLEIKWIRDVGTLKRSIYTLEKYPDDLLVTADDDFYFPRNWLKQLYVAYLNEPEYIHCHWALRMASDENGHILPTYRWKRLWEIYQGPSHDLLIFVGSGSLFPPGLLSSEIFKEDVFFKLCPLQDDIWLTAMAILKNSKIKRVHNYPINLLPVRGTQKRALKNANDTHITKHDQINAVFNYFGIDLFC